MIARRVGFMITIVLFMSSIRAQAGEVSSFGGERPVTIEDFKPHLMDVEGYAESWSHGVWLEDGSFIIGVDFSIHNLNLTSDHDAKFSAEFRDSRGKVTRCTAEYEEGDWKAGETDFWLRFGKSQLRGSLEGLEIKGNCNDLTLDLKFENQAAPVKPGSGTLTFGQKDGTYNAVFTAPRARVTGTVKQGGKTHSIRGIGHGMHTYYSLRPDQHARRWFRFKSIKSDYSVVLAELEAPPGYGQARNGWALVLGEKGRIVATARVRYDFDGFIKDTTSEEGYTIPRRVRLAAVDGKTHLTGVLLMKGIQKIVDPTENMGAVKRAVVRRYTKPRDYYLDCTYKLRVKSEGLDEFIQGDGFYRFVYANP